MTRVRFHDEARAELIHEVEFYTNINRKLGERFDQSVKAAVDLAAQFPEAGSPHFHGTRRTFTKKFPFSVVYLSFEGEIFVVALAPDSRKPRYWRSRVG